MKKRADGRYQKKITIDGKAHILYGDTIRAVNEKAYELINKPKASENFAYWMDVWWNEREPELKYNTAESYKRPIEDVREAFGSRQIAEIKPSEIKAFLNEMKAQKYARQTVNLRHIVLCKVFDYAIEHDVDIANAARSVKLPSGLTKSERQPLTDEQIKAVVRSENLFANFLLFTGLRRNEALAVKWENINFTNKTIAIADAIVWVGNKPTTGNGPKTKRGVRKVPLLAPLENLLFPIQRKSGYIFHHDGNPLEKKQHRMMWEKFIKQIGFDITAHQFRHTYVTMMYYAGIDVKTAQGIVGHAKVDTLLNIYTHLDAEAQEGTRAKLDNYFGGRLFN